MKFRLGIILLSIILLLPSQFVSAVTNYQTSKTIKLLPSNDQPLFNQSNRGFTTYNTVSEKDFIFFQNNNISTIRIMLMDGDLFVHDSEFIPGKTQPRITADNLIKLRNIISLGKKYGIKIIFDVHELPGLKRWFLAEGEEEDWRLWENSTEGTFYRNLLVKLWSQIAREFRYEPSELIIFELFNEPVPRLDKNNWADETYGYIWNDLQDRIIKEIRKYDKTHMIIAAPPYSWRPSSLSEWTPSSIITKDRRLIVAVHFFYPINYTYQLDAWNGTTCYTPYEGWFNEQYYGYTYWDFGRISDILNNNIKSFYDKYGIKVYISEFGVNYEAPGADKWLSDMIGAMNLFPDAVWGWTAHVWGEENYAASNNIAYDQVRTSMFNIAYNKSLLDIILWGINY